MPLNPDNVIQIGGVDVEDEGITEKFSYQDKPMVTRTVRVAWTDRYALYAALLGGGTTTVGAITTTSDPTTYPDAPWLFCLYCELAEMLGTPSLGENGMVAYDTCRIKITYGQTDNLTVAVDIGEEMLTLPADQVVYQWADGTDLPPDALPSIPITVGTVTYTLLYQPGIPQTLDYIDTTNDTALFGYPAGTLLYKGFSSKQTFSATGTTQATNVHNWKYRSNGGNGWNYFLKPGSGWTQVLRKDNGQPPFPPMHHQAIIGGV